MKEEKNKWRLQFEKQVKASTADYKKSLDEIKQLKDTNERKDKLST